MQLIILQMALGKIQVTQMFGGEPSSIIMFVNPYDTSFSQPHPGILSTPLMTSCVMGLHLYRFLLLWTSLLQFIG